MVTQWRTWLSAVEYYACNFESFASVINELNKDDAFSIEILQLLLSDSTIKNNLAYLQISVFSARPSKDSNQEKFFCLMHCKKLAMLKKNLSMLMVFYSHAMC